jgi:large subunit ribosomal protein L6
MSRVGKQIVEIPNGTEITLAEGILTVKGKKGELKKEFKTDTVSVDIKDNQVTFAIRKEEKTCFALQLNLK